MQKQNQVISSPLYDEQVQYIRKNKKTMFSFLNNMKIGFDLNVTIYFSAVLIYELRKKYEEIAPEINTEQFVIEECGSLMDSVIVSKGEDYSLRESMKTEVIMSVLAQYVKKKRTEKITTAKFRIQRKQLQAVIENAQKEIEAFFSSQEVKYQDIADIFDIYELHIKEDGTQVDLHLGRFGLTMNKKATAKDLLSHTAAQRVKYQEKKEFVKSGLLEVRAKEREVIQQFYNEAVLKDSSYNKLSTLYQNRIEDLLTNENGGLSFSEYTVLSEPKDKLRDSIQQYLAKLDQTKKFLFQLYHEGFYLPKYVYLDIENQRFYVKEYSFHYREQTAKDCIQEYSTYVSVRNQLLEIQKQLNQHEVMNRLSFKGNVANIVCSSKSTIKGLDGKATSIADIMSKPRQVNMVLYCKEGCLFRETGEQVLTSEVIVFELLERLRTVDEKYLEAVRKAKEMLISILSIEEETLLKEHGMTVLTGEKNYYVLLNTQAYNNVIRIPKNVTSLEDAKALCIHPADPRVPLHDGLAAIALAVKSGDEEYILKNSNEFAVTSSLKEKIEKVFNMHTRATLTMS